VRTQIEEIEEHVREVGFIPKIQIEEDATRIDILSKQQQLYDDFDLVVVDYDLGNRAMTGDHVAQIIRSGFGFTDIIFYSGHKTVDLRKLIHERHIDGVYCLERPRLSERLGDHIDQVVRRLSRLEAMRGLAMGTVGKCDDELRLLLAAEHAAGKEEFQQGMVATLDGLVADSARLQGERYSVCKTLGDRLENRAVTSFHLQKLALAILKGNVTCASHRKVLGRYNDEVLRPRNTLGHAIETRGDRGWEVATQGDPAIGTAEFPKLRQNMALHLENINALRPLLEGERGK
jgi:hypothetical protein